MLLGQLSELSGVSSARIKLYLREGLLPAGRKRNATRAAYDDTHLERLKMIDALRVEGLSLAEIRTLTDALDDENIPPELVLSRAQTLAVGSPEAEAQWDGLDDLMARHDWPAVPTDSSQLVATVAQRITQLGLDLPDELLDGYARAAELVAAVELAGLEEASSRDEEVTAVVQGIRHYDRLLLAMVSLARTSHYLRGS